MSAFHQRIGAAPSCQLGRKTARGAFFDQLRRPASVLSPGFLPIRHADQRLNVGGKVSSTAKDGLLRMLHRSRAAASRS